MSGMCQKLSHDIHGSGPYLRLAKLTFFWDTLYIKAENDFNSTTHVVGHSNYDNSTLKNVRIIKTQVSV